MCIIDVGAVGGGERDHQYNEVQDVQREEAQKEAHHHGNNDPECFPGARATT